MFRAPILLCALIALAALGSGAASLTLEVVWSKALVVPLGNSSDATALVLAGFMLGIAFGARLGARLAHNALRALYLYAGLELLLGMFALFVPMLMVGVSGLAVPQALSSVPWAAFALRLLASMCLIVFPCLVMGATLPLLLTTPPSLVQPRRFVAWLYGANTLGATLAAVVTGFYGIANWGIAGCSRRAAVGSASAALLAILASSVERATTRAAATSNGEDSSQPSSAAIAAMGPNETARPADVPPELDTQRHALLVTFVSGFVLLAAEVFWARILTFVFGHDTYAFATLLSVVLLGLALGGLGYTLFTKCNPRRVAGWAMASTACSLLLSFYVASWLMIRLGRDPFALGNRFIGNNALSSEMLREFAFTPILVLLPSLCSGVAYPATIAFFAGTRGSVSQATGAVGLVNGLGATAGASVTTLGLVAWLGIQGSLSTIALVSAATAAWLLFESTAKTKWRGAWAPAILLPLLGVALVPKDLPRRMLLAVVGPRHQTLLHYEEARTATVSVIENGIVGERQLLVNAVNEVTTRLVHDQSFKLLGQLGPLLHPDPKNAVMICLGAGLAAGSALSHPLERLDVVDLLRSVRHGARLFAEENNHVLEDPRLALHVNDGRQYLLLTNLRYDLAIVDSTHPKSVDSWILYTREFFELLRARLAPGGIVVQWLPLHGLSEREFIAVVATFASVFPQMTLWASVGYETYGQVGYAKLVGQNSEHPLRIDVSRLESRLSLPQVHHDLSRYGMATLPELLDQFVAGPDRIRAWTEGSPRLSDDRPFLAYLTPLAAGRPMTPDRLLAVREPVRPYLGDPDVLDGKLMAEIELAFDAQGLVISGQLEQAAALYPTGEKVRYYIEQTKTSLPYYSALAERYADDAERLFEAGTQLGALGHLDSAQGVFERALRQSPNSLRLALNAGLLALGSSEPQKAAETFSALLRRHPTLSLLHQNLGAALLAQREPGAARRELLSARAQDPESIGTRLTLADAEMALGNWSAARSLLESLLREEPRLESAMVRLTWVSEALGDAPLALKWSERAAYLDPYREDLMLNWGKRLAESQPRKAFEVLQRAERLHPESCAIKVALGEVALRLEQWQKAVVEFVLALERDPHASDAALGLGHALGRLDRAREALDAFCLAHKLGAARPRVAAELASIGKKLEDCTSPNQAP